MDKWRQLKYSNTISFWTLANVSALPYLDKLYLFLELGQYDSIKSALAEMSHRSTLKTEVQKVLQLKCKKCYF
jgi:hypothetical protein